MLLFSGVEKEYKQSKLKAAKNCGVRILPSNFEIGLELSKIIEEIEGERAKERLIEMRLEALKVMKILHDYCPLLIGSTWRGMVRLASDIDIEVFGDSFEKIISILEGNGLKILKVERAFSKECSDAEMSIHIYLKTWKGYEMEIIVRAPQYRGRNRKCDIFGDDIKGLNSKELEKLLSKDPAQKFLPNNS
jgi:predicted nucleotidyltransferase